MFGRQPRLAVDVTFGTAHDAVETITHPDYETELKETLMKTDDEAREQKRRFDKI